jgi:hypothetical protein
MSGWKVLGDVTHDPERDDMTLLDGNLVVECGRSLAAWIGSGVPDAVSEPPPRVPVPAAEVFGAPAHAVREVTSALAGASRPVGVKPNTKIPAKTFSASE